MPTATRPFVLVLAGVNGAGKSSVGGALLADQRLPWFNPDSYARELVRQRGLPQVRANALAWEHGRWRLEACLAEGANYAFETTLGGNSIPALLARATRTHDVMMLYCGLASPALHLARIEARVARGGHPIPEAKVRERWVSARSNLIALMPLLSHLQVFDNSAEVAPGEPLPDPLLVLEMAGGRMCWPDAEDLTALSATPAWARPLLEAALSLAR